jgi:hypothetical protein
MMALLEVIVNRARTDMKEPAQIHNVEHLNIVSLIKTFKNQQMSITARVAQLCLQTNHQGCSNSITDLSINDHYKTREISSLNALQKL